MLMSSDHFCNLALLFVQHARAKVVITTGLANRDVFVYFASVLFVFGLY